MLFFLKIINGNHRVGVYGKISFQQERTRHGESALEIDHLERESVEDDLKGISLWVSQMAKEVSLEHAC